MRILSIFMSLVLSLFLQPSQAQKTKTDANIFGHVICADCDEHLSFASLQVKGTTIGTTTDETGHYQFINLPAGTQTLKVTYMGYKPAEATISIKAGESRELNFVLEKDALGLEEVVVSAYRAEQKRTDAPVIVNTITRELFNTTQSATLGESLNFSPGLRLENNCQNCGFSQVRMNGMEGPYSQILINSRPIFSGLAGVYGLELIPTNMIERVEVVRGGGSALFGSNAVAGTVNIILKDPGVNSYEGGFHYTFTGAGVKGSGGQAPDHSVNFNTSVVSDDQKTGISLYGFTRKREMFDANNDTFSEIAPIENLTFGARAFHRFGLRDKMTFDYFAIHEKRDGGNKQDYPLHERDIAEALTHLMKVAGITYERFFRDYDLFSAYASGQFLDRDSYYGAGKSLDSYGNSRDHSWNTGIQYKASLGSSILIGGLENTGDFLLDKKLGYPELNLLNDTSSAIIHRDNTVVSDQSSVTTGIFAQYELKINLFKVVAGARFDHYQIRDLTPGGHTKSGNVISPRVSLMMELLRDLQAR